MDQQRLTTALVEFARTLTSEFSIQTLLDSLVEHVVHVVGVTGAGVLLMDDEHRHRFVAASDGIIRRIEVLQLEKGEGPCLEAFRTGTYVAIPDLATDTQFDEFSPVACAAGLGAVYSFPLRIDDTRLGALEVYTALPARLDADEVTAAQVLADVAAAYLFNAEARRLSHESLETMQTQSLHDALTGLPNRLQLHDRLDKLMAGSADGTFTALLFLDIDRFKSVNDAFGHAAGDLLLIEFVRRVQPVVPVGGMFARLSGDEFVLVCEGLTDVAAAQQVAARAVAAIDETFAIGAAGIAVTVSVGIAFCGPGRDCPDVALAKADAAMYEAKQKGGRRHVTASSSGIPLSADPRRTIESGLAAAIRDDQLHLVYEPIVDASTARLVGVETSLGWEHPELGSLPAPDILSAARRVGLSVPLLRWVLSTVCDRLQDWDERLPDDAPGFVGINVALRELLQPELVEIMSEALASSRLPGRRLCFEITEDIYLGDDSSASRTLHWLRAIGVRIALDGFGNGFSSLLDVKTFPVDVVKIGPAFVAGASDSEVDQAIVAAVVHLARSLDLKVVAAGVATAAQLCHVRDLGCHWVQGPFCSVATPDTSVRSRAPSSAPS